MPSFGESLKTQRELRGVSLREMADSTKISVRFLKALEEDRLDVLPGGIYPRAFVKQYALFLGLDPERTVADFLLRQGRPEPERRPAKAERWPRVTPGAVFFAVVVVVAAFLTFRRPAAEDKGVPLAAAPTSAPPTAPAVLPTDRLYPPPAPKSAPEPAPDTLLLTMTAQQDCWVEARADGETMINRVLAEGESETLEARGEIVLSVGNAGGLSIRVNDRPGLPLGRNGEVRKNIVITRKSLPALVKGDEPTAADGQSG
jgi:cytoskeleton protein RodZ